MRDERSQMAILEPLQYETEQLKTRTESILLQLQMEMEPPGSKPAGAPPGLKVCSDKFKGPLWRTLKGWNISSSDRDHLLADPEFYDALHAFYGTMGNAPENAKNGDMSARTCQAVVMKIDSKIGEFLKKMMTHMQTLNRDYRTDYPWVLLSRAYQHIYFLFAAFLGVILVLPLALRAGEHKLRQWFSSAGSSGPEGESAPESPLLPRIGFVDPPVESTPMDDEATTHGNR
jgi:hypothetical protein